MRACNGICDRYKVKRPKGKAWYSQTVKRCGTCNCLINFSGIKCPCCKSKLGTKTRRLKKDVARYD